MFEEILFCDSLGRLNDWALEATVFLVELFDQGSTRTRDIEC
jgi:hypothetical protein